MQDKDHKDSKPIITPPPPASRDQTIPPAITNYSVPPADMLTEQEKDTTSSTPGVGPAPASEATSGPVETIEDLGIGPREPYPTGNPPPPSEITTRSEGIKGAAEKKVETPSETRGPAGTTRK